MFPTVKDPDLDTARRQCPNCDSQYTRRSHRRGLFERYVLQAFGMVPYRCDDCYKRFYSRRSRLESYGDENSPAIAERNRPEVRVESPNTAG